MSEFNEIKEILKNLAISQAKTDIQFAETDKKIKELAISQAKTDAQLAATDAQLAATHAQLAETDAQLAKTDKKLKKIGVLTGNISNNQGDVAEEFFYNSISDKPSLAGVTYDFVDKNVTRKKQGIEDEYDILMVNGKDIAIIEVKYKAHQSDLERFIHKKYANFKKLYPEYQKFTHHLALASFKINDEVKNEALKNGVMVLQRKGKVFETILPD